MDKLLFDKSLFSESQIREIELGLKKGLDWNTQVRHYANPEIWFAKMNSIRKVFEMGVTWDQLSQFEFLNHTTYCIEALGKAISKNISSECLNYALENKESLQLLNCY